MKDSFDFFLINMNFASEFIIANKNQEFRKQSPFTKTFRKVKQSYELNVFTE